MNSDVDFVACYFSAKPFDPAYSLAAVAEAEAKAISDPHQGCPCRRKARGQAWIQPACHWDGHEDAVWRRKIVLSPKLRLLRGCRRSLWRFVAHRWNQPGPKDSPACIAAKLECRRAYLLDVAALNPVQVARVLGQVGRGADSVTSGWHCEECGDRLPGTGTSWFWRQPGTSWYFAAAGTAIERKACNRVGRSTESVRQARMVWHTQTPNVSEAFVSVYSKFIFPRLCDMFLKQPLGGPSAAENPHQRPW